MSDKTVPKIVQRKWYQETQGNVILNYGWIPWKKDRTFTDHACNTEYTEISFGITFTNLFLTYFRVIFHYKI